MLDIKNSVSGKLNRFYIACKNCFYPMLSYLQHVLLWENEMLHFDIWHCIKVKATCCTIFEYLMQITLYKVHGYSNKFYDNTTNT